MVRSPAPEVEYASSVWSPYTKQSKLEMIQRTAARWVKNNYSPYESESESAFLLINHSPGPVTWEVSPWLSPER